jgi:hypothetical protein
MLVTQNDVIPIGGAWPRATTRKADEWEITPKPNEDVGAIIRVRKGEDELCLVVLCSLKIQGAIKSLWKMWTAREHHD